MAENDPIHRALRLVRGVQAAVDVTAPRPARKQVAESPESANTKHVRTEPLTAFVSWAHSHSSWTKGQTSQWESQVAAFAALLRRLGIGADVDLFHLDEPQDWTRYGPREVVNAKFTLVVMSQAWAERWSGTNSPREGAGAAAEADTLRGLFARDQEAWQRRVVVVMFPEVASDIVPPDLQRVARVPVDPASPDSFEPLIRLLTEQPRYPKPPVGAIPVLNVAAGYEEPEALAALRDRLSEIEKRKRQIRHRTSDEADAERERLAHSESATRGFIDAELTVED